MKLSGVIKTINLVILTLTLIGCSKSDDFTEQDSHTKSLNSCSTAIPNNDPIDSNNANFRVKNLSELKDAIHQAVDGNIIYIEDNATINVAEFDTIVINKSITLASGRGIHEKCGALIKTDAYGLVNATTSPSQWVNNSYSSHLPILVIQSSGVRITGIRFQGPYGNIESNRARLKVKKGINIANASENVVIDNCELYDFPYYAIGVEKNVNNKIIIKHNHFHNNRQSDYGYGVAIGGEAAFSLVTHNIFDKNRHDITCSGHKGSGYEFSYNEIRGNNVHPNIDVHGGQDFGGEGDSYKIAGSFFYVHHNTFINSPQTARNILIRGIPEIMFLAEKNKFVYDNMGDVFAIDASRLADGTNVFAFNNSYGGYVKGHIFPENYHHNVSDITYLPMMNTGASILNMMQVGCGDFDGNGRSEIFVNRNNRWYTINYPKPETMHIRAEFDKYKWVDLGGSGYQPNNLKIADFNGDGKTDIFSTTGNDWQIAYSPIVGWEKVNYSPSYNLTNLKFGDFDGDGKTDTFKSNGTNWSISKGAKTTWIEIGSSDYDLSQLLTGNFNSNITTDVFVSNEVKWFYADYTSGNNWQVLNTSSEKRENLFSADLDNNGETDIYRKFGNGYKVSKGGKSNWEIFSLE
ncbi:FG-GAP repeat domain-containing protein [Aquimarina megaterium]|uniref:FG-GAP repeat domain-containing protein n=1 Tax=Aquimarina megaterium TaxID=1443666 RepID=UPI00046FD484|nr:VCBS repeat-containing protein [Aquimarina megaterium]